MRVTEIKNEAEIPFCSEPVKNRIISIMLSEQQLIDGTKLAARSQMALSNYLTRILDREIIANFAFLNYSRFPVSDEEEWYFPDEEGCRYEH